MVNIVVELKGVVLPSVLCDFENKLYNKVLFIICDSIISVR